MNMWTGFADADLALLLGVQATLNESIQAAGAGRDWRLPTECVPAIGRMLLRCVALRCVATRRWRTCRNTGTSTHGRSSA